MVNKIFIFFIIISIIFRFSLINLNKGYWWDEVVYLGLAKNLYEKFEFGIPPPIESFRPVFLPILIAIGNHFYEIETIAKIIVLSFSVLSLIAVFVLAKNFYDEETALVTSIMLGTNHLFLFYGQRIFTESIFITFYSISLFSFFIGIEKQKKFLILSAMSAAICALTKNFGFLIPIIFIIYFFLRKKFDLLKSWQIYVSILLYFIVLTPFLYFLFLNYGNFFKFLNAQSSNVPVMNSEVDFYFTKFFDVFGLNGIFILFGTFFLLRKIEHKSLFLLLTILVPMIVFNTILSHHKEERYLIPFFPSFFLIGASSFKFLKKEKRIALSVLIFFSTLSFINGHWWILSQANAGIALKDACMFLKEIIKNNESVISESYPYVFYFSGMNAIKPPSDEHEFYKTIEERNVSVVLIYYSEPGNPGYLIKELQTEKFEKLGSFINEYNSEEVAIFRYKK
ncbi:MAG: glycosyltransferase family 39 protein [Candidatus Parvarchaeota archaeon]|nr:glycosyltransferase family 39 protein [Candidatus Jingweiarchaeum tengchongense]MCW1297846.1 glycosyltransferase family 39 protein [Candidatus Jingweiarchaeum tengchongense]MCW1299857.1 glycosyltransferase family 39 protein [Candidatus Jingweiarchaeum tengchongense]MCW1304173.1 glycosyltransferase family 39 protein [Candidatus Jingweiarchaeum tengchongense]MCW1305201.1 glycosyltransferase family 39 protein [Candidatus Jingweiarchaeum tengchongense]